MSSDEEMAIIGRMVTERKTLSQTDVALSEEVLRIGEELQKLGRKVGGNFSSVYTRKDIQLSDDERATLDGAKLDKLLGELQTVRTRVDDLNAKLEKAGL